MSIALSPDHNLLFGLLALQMEFVTQGQLTESMHGWVLEKQTPLGEILVRRGIMDADDRADVEKLLGKHLRRHGGDVQTSLAALRVDPLLIDSLATLSGTDSPDSVIHSTVPPTDSCGPATVPPSAAAWGTGPGAAPGRARYARLRPHAKGGLGEVSVARDEELGREVALKEIQGRFADHPDSRARFVREAEITGRLEHPGVVPIYGLGAHADGRPFYAMRFIRGESMHDTVSRFHEADGQLPDPGERSLALRGLLERFVAVCNATAFAHSRGVIHRDLKPANVMLGEYGETLVVDWGLARVIGAPDATTAGVPASASGTNSGTATQAGQAVGTPAFMPPEQATGRLDEMGPASDVFSLGAILYAVLTGGPPYTGATSAEMLEQAQRGAVEPARQRKPDVPRALEAVCARAMAAAPKDRYSTAKELAEEVRRWLADEPVAAYREPLADRARRWARRHRTLTTSAAAVLVAGVVALGAGLWAVNQQKIQTAIARDDALRAEQRERERAIEAETNLARAVKAEREANKNLKLARNAVDDTFGLVREHPLLQRDHEFEVRRLLLRKVLPYLRIIPQRAWTICPDTGARISS